MKKLLIIGLLFAGMNCVGMTEEDTISQEYEICLLLEYAATSKLSYELPAELCVKALDQDKPCIAEYIGLKLLGIKWRKCRRYLALQREADATKPELAIEIDARVRPRIKKMILDLVREDQNFEVAAFIEENA